MYKSIKKGINALSILLLLNSPVFATEIEKNQVEEPKYEFQINKNIKLKEGFLEKEIESLSNLQYASTQEKQDVNKIFDSVVLIKMMGIEKLTPKYFENHRKLFFQDEESICNGLLVSKDGHVITENHCVNHDNFSFMDYKNQIVIASDQNTYDVERILAFSRELDLALIKTNMKKDDIAPIYVIRKSDLKKDENLTAIGKTLHTPLFFTFSKGKIKVANPWQIELDEHYLGGPINTNSNDGWSNYTNGKGLGGAYQIVKPGFSGCPELSENGFLVGIIGGSNYDWVMMGGKENFVSGFTEGEAIMKMKESYLKNLEDRIEIEGIK